MTDEAPSGPTDSGARRIQEVAMGYYSSQALYVAAELGIADLLESGPMPVPDLAAAAGADEDSLFRILRLLARDGVFELSGGVACLNQAAEQLKTGGQGTMRDLVVIFGREFYRAFGELLSAVRSGDDAFRVTFGRGLFEYLKENPDRGRAFDRAMGAGAVFFNSVPDAYNFAPVTTVVDVGGGNGTLLGSILAAHPHVEGILFDAAPVIESAVAHPRLTAVAGNFFNSIVEGGDAYLFSRILHDWSDQQCLKILANCRRAIDPGGRILVIERLLPGAYATAADVNMLAVTGGRERSREEFAALMSRTGFELRRVIPLPLEYNVIEGAAV